MAEDGVSVIAIARRQMLVRGTCRVVPPDRDRGLVLPLRRSSSHNLSLDRMNAIAALSSIAGHLYGG